MADASELIQRDIESYLMAQQKKSLLRFITCGSVDDGKSTLIGRLLFESQLLFEDHLAALEADSKRVGTQGDDLDFALLLDGLAAEREQGITIDVAYRYFSTDTRKYIVADTPGDAAAQLSRLAARDPSGRRRREQDGSRRILGRALRRDRARLPRARVAARVRRRDVHPALGPARRQHDRAQRGDVVVRRADADGLLRDGRGRPGADAARAV